MDETRIRQIIREEIANAASNGLYSVTKVPYHVHNNLDAPTILVNNVNFNPPGTIFFNGQTTQYRIYRESGDNGALNIDAETDYGNEVINIGGVKKPLIVNINGGDEANLRADNNTNASYILVEPTKAGLFTDAGNNFYFRLPNGGGDPSATVTGALAVVSGKLKIYDGSSWVVVGTQT